jgi:hypothetical protein
VTDAVHHRAGRERALVEVELPQRLLHQALPVVLVVDHEGGREPGLGRALSQDAHTRRVEGGDERRADTRGQQQILDAMAHLRGGLVGEGHREHVPRVDALDRQEIGDAVRDDAGLAAPRPGQDEHGPLRGRDRVSLRRVQGREETVRGHRRMQHGNKRDHRPARHAG